MPHNQRQTDVSFEAMATDLRQHRTSRRAETRRKITLVEQAGNRIIVSAAGAAAIGGAFGNFEGAMVGAVLGAVTGFFLGHHPSHSGRHLPD